MLDLDGVDLPSIACRITDHLEKEDQIDDKEKEKVLQVLLLKHRYEFTLYVTALSFLFIDFRAMSIHRVLQ